MNLFKRGKIRCKIFISLIGTILLSATLISVVVYFIVKETLQEKIEKNLLITLEAKQDAFNRELRVNEDFLKELAANSLLVNSLVDIEGQKTYLPIFMRDLQIPGYRNSLISLTDFEGKIIASNQPDVSSYENEAWVDLVMQGNVYSDVRMVQKGSKPRLLHVLPVIYNNFAEGMLVVEVDLDQVELLATESYFSYFLVDQSERKVLIKPEGEEKLSADIIEAVLEKDGVLIALHGNEGLLFGNVPLYDDFFGLSLAIIVTINEEEAFKALNDLKIAILLIGITVFVLSTLIAFLLSKSLSQPIQEMTSVVSEIIDKDGLGRRVKVKSEDEIGQLGYAFNKMLKRLRNTINENYLVNEERKKVEEAYQIIKEREEEVSRLALISRHTDNLVIMTDLEGRIKWANDAFQKNTLYQPDEYLGEKPGDLLQGENTNPNTVKHIKECLSQRKGFNVEIINYDKEGREYWLDIEVRPHYNNDGEMIGFFAIEADITERKKLELEQKNLNDKLQRSNQELHQFAYVASHDLQEPLRMVSSYMELLVEEYGDQLDADAKEYIHFAVDGSRRMKILIEDLLSYARTTEIDDVKSVNLEEVIDKVIEDNQLSIKEKKAVVKFTSPLPTICVNSRQMHQLFTNLISNALKYTAPDVPPVIEINAVKISYRSQPYWKIGVKDNGIGIEEQYIEKIFVIFQRLHGKSSSYKGTGIGLAICEKIVKLHNGKIWVESKVGEGSTFYMTFPAE